MKYRYQPKRPGFIKRSFTNTVAIAVILANAVGGSLPFILSAQRVNAAYAYPSTHEENILNNWAKVVKNSATINSVTLEFFGGTQIPSGNVSCFEYRSDGDTSQDTGITHPLSPAIEDRYPHLCVNGSNSTEMTLPANNYVEVRSAFGAESDERFDWTAFTTLPPTVTACTTTSSVFTTDLGTWDFSQTRTSGFYELELNNLHAWTEPSGGSYANEFSKSAGYFDVDFALEDAGIPGIEFDDYSGVRPSLQLGIDKDANGSRDAYLVYEPWAYGEGNYWATTYLGVPAGLGYASFGSLNDFLAANPSAKIVEIGYSLGSGVIGDANISSITAGCVEYTFGIYVPPCDTDDTTFDTFSNGTVNGQFGWQVTNPNFDQEIVDNVYGFSEFGCKSLRISNSYTTGSFGDQTFSYSVPNEAGEPSAENGGLSGGVRQNRFEAEWSFASTTPNSEQTGLNITASPDRGDGARMSWIQMADASDGLKVNFYDYQVGAPNTGSGEGFVYTTVASGLDRSTPHKIRVTIDFLEGSDNDVVKVYVDDVLMHTGNSWEDYFRITEGNPTRTVDSLLFRSSGPAVGSTDGEGFLIDNVSIHTTSSPNTAPNVTFESPTPSENENVSGTFTPHVLTDDDFGMGSYYIRLWKGAFESGVANLVSNNCYSAPGAFLLGTSQDVTCPEIDTTTLDDGKYVLSAQFLDGHTTWGSALRTIYVDNTAPAVPTNLMWTPEGGSAMASGGNTNVQKGTLDWQDLDTSVDKYKYYFWTDIPGYFEGESNAWTTEGTTYITQSPTGGSIWTDFYNQEGTYYFCIKAIDALGNTSTCSDTFSVTYDNTAPDAPVHEYPADNAVINFNDFWFEWSDVSDAVSYETQYSQSPGVGVDGAFTNVDWTGDYQNIQPTESKAHSVGANGTWYWQVRSVDAAGNKSGWTTPWKLTIDLVAPDAFNVSPADGSVVNGASITQEWGSSASDVDYFIYESYHDSGASSQRWYEEISGTSKTATNVGEAEYWWRVKAVDIAGNEGDWSPLWKITVDNTSPVITTNLPFGAIVNGTITIEEYVADNNPDQFGLSIYEDDGTTLMLTNNTDTTVVNTITELPDGEYIAKFTAIDKAGNEAALDVWFTVDNSKPTALITSPASGDILSGDLTVEGTASDAQTNITEVLYTVTEIDAIGGDYVASIVNGTASYNDSTDTFEFDVLGLTDGYYRLKIQAFDEAGNWKYHHIDVEIDNTAPVVTINSLSPSTNTTPSITGTIDDALANIFVAINGSVPQAATNNGDGTWSFAVLSPLTVDTHTVEAYATDQNGNTTAPAPTINFSVTAPPLGVSTGSPNSNTNSNSSSNSNSNGNTPTVNAFTASSTDSEVLAAETDEDGDTPTSNEDGSDVAADTDISISNPGAETDEEDSSDNGMLDLWWLWLILLAILAGILYYLFRPKNNEA